MKTHNRYGETVEDRIRKIPAELDVDAVGLWHIVSSGEQGFDLSGDELTQYVRRHLMALFARGARPVTGATDGIHIWQLLDYGDTPEKTADAIIDQWIRAGRDPHAGGVWFATPNVYNEKLPTAR